MDLFDLRAKVAIVTIAPPEATAVEAVSWPEVKATAAE
jgi:hypothetical protein